jgi:hypothetical protein
MIKKLDLFPAVILVAPPESLSDYTKLIFFQDKPKETRRVDRCRVSILNSTIYVVVDTPEGFSIIFKEKLADYSKSDAQHNAITVSGKILAFRKDENCGCGSRLRSWSPFGKQVTSNNDPQE